MRHRLRRRLEKQRVTTAKSARAARTAKATALKGSMRPQGVSNGTLVAPLLSAGRSEVLEQTASHKVGGGNESMAHGSRGTRPEAGGATRRGEEDMMVIDDSSDGGGERYPKKARTQETVEPAKRAVHE